MIRVIGKALPYAVLVGGANGDGACGGLVTIVELIDPRPRPCIFKLPCRNKAAYIIHAVICMSDRLITQANPNPRLPPKPDLRSLYNLQDHFQSIVKSQLFIFETCSSETSSHAPLLRVHSSNNIRTNPRCVSRAHLR